MMGFRSGNVLLYPNWLRLGICIYGQVTKINLKRVKAHSFNFVTTI